MDDRLQRLTRSLRSEKCPPHVVTQVRERIASERRANSPSLRLPVWASGLVVLVAVAVVGFELSRSDKTDSYSPASNTTVEIDRKAVAEEVQLSLACIGHVLIEAGNRSGTVIHQKMLPPLLNSLRTAQESIINPQKP